MSLKNPLDPALPLWRTEEGKPIPCVEKIKVMNENYLELQQLLRDFLEDGVLMGCAEQDLRGAICQLVETVALNY